MGRPVYAAFQAVFSLYPRSSGVPSLRRHQSPSQQIQIRQREAREQARRILRQSPVANFAKTPQALDHVEDMFDAGPSGGAATVDESLVLAQMRRAPVDAVADPLRQGGLTMRFAPVRLVAEHLTLLAMQQLAQLRDVTDVRRGGAQAVHDAAQVGTDVRLHPKVPAFALAGLVHLRIACLLFVLRRGRCSNDRRIDNRAALQQQPLLLQQRANLGKDRLGQFVALKQVPKAQDRRLIGNIVSHQLNPGKATHRLDIVERILGLRIRQIEPVLHEIDPQHLLHRLWLRAVTCFRVVRLDQRQQPRPGNHRVHLSEKSLAERDLALPLPSNEANVVCCIVQSTPLLLTAHSIGHLMTPVQSFPSAPYGIKSKVRVLSGLRAGRV
jgi:hypothetical protein